MKKTLDQLILFLMYINNNKIHGRHDIINQIESLHDFIQGIVRALSSANHHRVLAHGTVLKPLLKPLNDKRNPLIHDTVQVGRDTRHLRHHANLKKRCSLGSRS